MKRQYNHVIYRAAVLALTVIGGVGCSTTPPSSSNMVPGPPALAKAPPVKSLRVIALTEPGQGATEPTTGGFIHITSGAFEPADWARVTDQMFREALTNALVQSGLFKTVSGQRSQDYQLEGELYLQQMFAVSFQLTSTIGIKYKLTAIPSNKRIWADDIVSQGAGGGAADAVEMAMRNNLFKLVDKLTKLSLSTSPTD